MATPKEPNFFAEDLLHDEGIGAFTRMTLEQYHACFTGARSGQLRGEASACYLYSTEAARRIRAYNPAARIIIMLREPVAFLHSYHLQMLKNVASEGETVKNFGQALALEAARRQGHAVPPACLVPQLLYYTDRIRYAEQVERYLSCFPRKQVQVIIYDDFKTGNARTLRDVLLFLDVEPDFTPSFQQHNTGEKLRSKMMQRLMHDLTHGEGAFSAIQPVLKRILPLDARRTLIRCIVRTLVFRPKPDIDPELRHSLMRQFRGEVEKISDLLGCDLVRRWGYDGFETGTGAEPCFTSVGAE
jgi:hypothetical protein